MASLQFFGSPLEYFSNCVGSSLDAFGRIYGAMRSFWEVCMNCMRSFFRVCEDVYRVMKDTNADVYYALINLALEIASAVVEQVANGRVKFAACSLGFAAFAVVLSIGEIAWMKKEVIAMGYLDLFGLVAAVGQLLVSALELCLILNKVAWRITFTMFSLIFAVSYCCYKIFWRPRLQFLLRCHDNGEMQLNELKDISTKTKTVYECPICAVPDHPYHNCSKQHFIPMDEL